MPLERNFSRWLLAGLSLLAAPTLLHAQIFTWTEQGDLQNNPWMASMVRAGFSSGDDDAMVAKLRALPQGKRCLMLWDQNHAVFGNVLDGADINDKIYWPEGIAEAHLENARVIGVLTAANIKPDVVLLDDEDAPNCYTMNAQQQLDVTLDPHASSLPWPTLPLSNAEDVLTFNNLIVGLERVAMHDGVLADYEAYAPNALTCNFAERMCTRDEANVAPDLFGNPYAMPTISGKAQAPGMYLTATSYLPTQTPYGLAMYGTNVLRVSVRHSPVLPWYGSESVDGPASWAGTGYWEEFIRHGILTCGLQGMLFDATDSKASARVSSILYDVMKTCDGTLPQTLRTTDVATTGSQWFASARVDTDTHGNVTRIIGRVTFAPNVSTAQVVIAGKTFNVTRPPRQVGAWIHWHLATSSPKLY